MQTEQNTKSTSQWKLLKFIEKCREKRNKLSIKGKIIQNVKCP